ncbi:MAG: DNA mismatch repair endonuclease MutL [Bacillota bacterium]|nr:DNA mismatch repair endonuclease MutL [Bacillota bacterium]
MSIVILDEHTRDKIAAGEVVERPASVVKELVENALDADAKRIEVRLDGAGDAITVTDDGCGMSPEDLSLCIHRHATSKIRTADDLALISSYGFRGEALPSIAAVSELEIRTRPGGSDTGNRIVVSAGNVIATGEAPSAPGTTVHVRRLFFNTPVRARFLRSARAELARAVGMVEKLALARPDVAFRCESGGRLVLHTPGGGDYLETLLALAGLETAREVCLGSAAVVGARAVALVGSPATCRADRRRQGAWINSRPVSVRGLVEAAEAAYPWGVLPGRRHPLLYLLMSLPPEDVDVNVHPAKAEVRLADGTPAFALAAAAVRDAAAARVLAGAADIAGAGLRAGDIAGAADIAGPAAPPGMQRRVRYGEGPAGEPGAGTRSWPQPAGRAGHMLAVGEAPAAWDLWATDLSALRPLGQVGASWLACDGPGGLVVVDQHAAHERVIFEHLGAGTTSPGSQVLAIPAAVELSPGDFARWTAAEEVLAESGFVTEHFGGTGVLIREIPADLAGARWSPEPLLVDILAALEDEARAAAPLGPRLAARRAVASCAAAVKAHQPLAGPELSSLLSQLASCREPWRCPHGRPTVILITHDELARRFGRQ